MALMLVGAGVVGIRIGWPGQASAATLPFTVATTSDILTGARDIGLQLRAGVQIGEIEVRRDDIAALAV